MDPFNAAIESSSTLVASRNSMTYVAFLDGEASHAIAILSHSNENYKLLKNRHGNPQLIVSAHMSAFVKIRKVETGDLHGLRKFYDHVESIAQSLRILELTSRATQLINPYESLLSTLIIEKLFQDIKLIISRAIETDIWDLTKVLHLISLELRARSRSLSGSNAVKCVFCKGYPWLDKCRVITDFLCQNVDLVSRNCPKSKPYFYCRQMQYASFRRNIFGRIPKSHQHGFLH